MQARAKTICRFLVVWALHFDSAFPCCHALLVRSMDERRIRQNAKLRLRKARQMIDKDYFTWKFVILDDVIDMVKAVGVTDLEEATRRAHRIWADCCFSLEIYRTTQGVEGTRAEFMCDWLRSGYSWEASITHLETLSLTNSPKRALSPTFKADAMKRLRENGART